MLSKYEYVIWLEIHIKLNSPNKLFCQCANVQEFDDLQANTNVCPVCMAQPWALPVLNKEPLEKAIMLWYELNCQINEYSTFERKSYFYPDLPAGFQITQFEIPTNGEWFVQFWVDDYEEEIKVRIERAHIENDAGKTIHENGKWIVDFNRAWTPLVEIVTFPDFTSDDQVVEFLKELQRRVRFNNISSADLEKWQMRCDVNISVREVWNDTLGTKVEVKNMNSFWAIKRAINHEFARQVEILEDGGTIDQETRWWDDTDGSSYTMRSKEDSLDYRYFPEPDLPLLKIEQAMLDEIKAKLVPSSYVRIKQYKEYWFNKEYINALINNIELNIYFEDIVNAGIKPDLAAKWIVGYILRFLNDNDMSLQDLKFTKQQFTNFLQIIQDWKLIDAHAKQVIKEMFETGKNAWEIQEEKWLKPVDSNEIQWIVQSVLDENPNAVDDLKSWQQKAIGFLVWQVMQKSQGKADPKQVKQIIENSI